MTSTETGTPSPVPTLTPTASATPAATAAPGLVLPYPNPAPGTGSVQVLFDLNGVDDVRLKVFSVAFRRVRMLDLGSLGPGPQATTVELKDEWGRDLANGLYYLVIEQGGDRSVGRLLIQR